MSQLNHLLVSEDDNDYLRTIIRIPTAPLLHFLEEGAGLEGVGCEGDSGYENGTRPRRDTTETRYGGSRVYAESLQNGGRRITHPHKDYDWGDCRGRSRDFLRGGLKL